MTGIFQSHWKRPTCENVTHDVNLMVMNSLTRSKEKFVTIHGDRWIKWYMCGPTVYAPSHLGHARTYVGFDIIRRILKFHFGFNVTLVMNITDLDDKIIQRANERGITCGQLSKLYESEFHEDMATLGVSPPDILTRVTDYIKEIIHYISTLVEKGVAYESNGSVYFSVLDFGKIDGMSYCKLTPEQCYNTELLNEGEGKSVQNFLNDKRSPRDFALWKQSKKGEPKWQSPWGEGRPGWHIECSVMASEIFKLLSRAKSVGNVACEVNCCMDIHSGGVDLKFPHHDNEMAQAEAYSGCKQWVNYFLHSGHLHIKGFKMSKSLKNFITIREALERNTPRQIRMCFLLHKYNAPMDYGDDTMVHAINIDRIFVEFFLNVKTVLRFSETLNEQRWNKMTGEMQISFESTRKAVDLALRDDFDTPTCIKILVDLVGTVNIYLKKCETEGLKPMATVVGNSARFVTHILHMFGLIPDSNDLEIGFPINGGVSRSKELNNEKILTPTIDAVVKFRSFVRKKALLMNNHDMLMACDRFRDNVLPPLGIRLEDKNPPVWKLINPIDYLEEQRLRKEEEKEKNESKLIKEEKKAKKDILNKIPPVEFMMNVLDAENNRLKYSKFDHDGLPTHTYDGKPLNKNQMKKARKEFQAQRKRYEKYNLDQGKQS